MVIKISLLFVLIACLFFPNHFAPENVSMQNEQMGSAVGFPAWIKSLGVSLIGVSFTYGGYQQTINFGNDVKEPSKNIPRGIFIGIAIIIFLYLLVNLSYYNIIGFNQMKGEKEIAFVVIDKIFGNTGAAVFSAFLFLGVLAYVNGSLLSNPRVMYAMGEDGSLPKLFTKQKEETNVLTFSLTAFTVICIIILFFSQQFEKILTFTIFLDCFGMILCSATIFWFRKKTKHLDGTGIYKMKLFPLMPGVFIAAYLFVGISISIADPLAAITGLAVLAAFVCIYFLLHRNKKIVSTTQI
jgi:APA family basic amino acid/polyamine antiporter